MCLFKILLNSQEIISQILQESSLSKIDTDLF